MGPGCGPVSRVSKRSSHPEVNQENKTALEPNNQILATPANLAYALAGELRSHLCGIDWTRQPGIEDVDTLEPATDQPGLKTRPDRLDFGQLGHRVSSLAPSIRVVWRGGQRRQGPSSAARRHSASL